MDMQMTKNTHCHLWHREKEDVEKALVIDFVAGMNFPYVWRTNFAHLGEKKIRIVYAHATLRSRKREF